MSQATLARYQGVSPLKSSGKWQASYQVAWQIFQVETKNDDSGSYGGFLKYGYPQIIHFRRIIHCKLSISGTPILGNLHIVGSIFFTYLVAGMYIQGI